MTDEQLALAYWQGRMNCQAGDDRDLAGRRAIVSAATAPLLERIAALEAKLAQRVPDELLRAAVFTVLEGFELRIDVRKILETAYYSAAHAAPEQRDQSEQHLGMVAQAPLQRAIDLNEKASMPWDDAFKLALEEIGIGDTEIDELIGNASPSALVTMLDKEEVREFVRSVLIHQHAPAAQAPNAQQAEPEGFQMTAHRAAYFMRRFRSEEKLLGPNEQAALKFTIEALEAMEAQQAEAQEPVATINISDDDFDFGLTDDYAFGIKRLPNGQHPLFTRPQPAQLQTLSDEEVRKAVIDCGMMYTAPDLRVSKAIQSALAAKNGVVLK